MTRAGKKGLRGVILVIQVLCLALAVFAVLALLVANVHTAGIAHFDRGSEMVGGAWEACLVLGGLFFAFLFEHVKSKI